MKICFAVDSLNNGGAERVVSTLSNQFVTSGNTVNIVIVSNSKSDPFYQLDNRIKIHCLNQNSKKTRMLKRIKLFSNKLKSIKPDVVIAFLPHVCFYSYFACKRNQIPLIVSERNNPKSMSFIKKTCSRFVFKRAKACVFQTGDALKWYGVNKSTIIPNPVFLQEIGAAQILKRENVITYVGRLEPQKNVKLLIDSFDSIFKKRNDFELRIYGSGSQKEELIKYAKTLPSNEHIRFMGINKNWHKLEKFSNTFVLPSNFEGMPNALEEALCLGIQCVATDCPAGGSKMLMNMFGYCNLLSKTGDLDELTKKITDSIDNDYRNANLIELNKKMLSPEHIAEKWLCLIKDII